MIREGTTVKWKEGNQEHVGTVLETYHGPIHSNTSGIPVLRTGKKGNKVLSIEKENGFITFRKEQAVERK